MCGYLPMCMCASAYLSVAESSVQLGYMFVESCMCHKVCSPARSCHIVFVCHGISPLVQSYVCVLYESSFQSRRGVAHPNFTHCPDRSPMNARISHVPALSVLHGVQREVTQTFC